MFIARFCSPYGLYTGSFGSSAGSKEDIAVSGIEFLFPSKNPRPICDIIGVCNGLIAIEAINRYARVMSDFRSIFVFNPSTRECRQIPDYFDRKGELIGFGYDHCSDDYKLVMLHHHGIPMYSLRNDSWRIVQDFTKLYFCPITGGTQLNQTLHWMCWLESNTGLEIAALSLVDDGDTSRLGLFEECLCIVSGYDSELWVMKEYGVEQSWTKLDMNITFPRILEPLGVLTDYEDLLLTDKNKLVLYNRRAGTKKDLVLQEVNKDFHATVYVDSLISPFMNASQRKV